MQNIHESQLSNFSNSKKKEEIEVVLDYLNDFSEKSTSFFCVSMVLLDYSTVFKYRIVIMVVRKLL